MKAIFFLALFAGIALAQNNHGDFFADSLIKAYSGINEALETLTTFNLTSQSRNKGWVNGTVSITDGKAWVTSLDTSSLTGRFDPSANTYIYTGFQATFNYTFKFADPFYRLSWVTGTVSGKYDLSSSSTIKVKYGINDTNKGPLYEIQPEIVLSSPCIEFVSDDKTPVNDTVIDDIKPWFSNETAQELTLAINKEVQIPLIAEYQKRAESFVQFYKYEFEGIEATINYSMLSISGQAGGLKILYDGSIVDYTVLSPVIGDFDASLAPTQAFLTKNFIEKAISYPISKGFFKWSFPDSASLRMPDLDFKASDLYFIFPDSIGQFSATDALKADCNIKSDPLVTFNTDANRLEVTLTLTCSVKVTPSTGTETHILDLTAPAVYYPDLSLSSDSKLFVQLGDTVLQGSVKVEGSKFAFGDRQQAIVDTLVQEAFEYYDLEHNVWGTGFQILPMKGAYFQVRDDGILFYGSHH